MFKTPEFWVGVAFVLFLCVMLYFKVPALITKNLDDRAEAISKELQEAQQMREEAQALLSEYQTKRREAEKDADNIVAQAKQEASSYAAETRRKLAESVERRTLMAEQRIAQAEAVAVKEVRAAATELAVGVAADLIAAKTKGATGARFVDESIAVLKQKLN